MPKRFLNGIESDYVTGLDAPLLPEDATNKYYVDNLVNRKYMKKLIDEVNKDLMYIGQSVPGADPATPVWAISRIVFDDEDVEIKWAESTNGFTNIWNDRLTYTYN